MAHFLLYFSRLCADFEVARWPNRWRRLWQTVCRNCLKIRKNSALYYAFRVARPVTTLARVMSATLLLTENAANSAVLFGDNFEPYALGSNVNGQGGWFSNSSSFQLLAKSVSQLGSQAIDGRLPKSSIQVSWQISKHVQEESK
ncbi:MAG TPA: hypothetical protein PKY22_11340 [Accumulibacter sp.]|nr:hypothetical protein [Accumulibacter sp.]